MAETPASFARPPCAKEHIATVAFRPNRCHIGRPMLQAWTVRTVLDSCMYRINARPRLRARAFRRMGEISQELVEVVNLIGAVGMNVPPPGRSRAKS